MPSGNRDPPDLSPSEARQRYLDQRRTEASASSIQSWGYRLDRFVDWAEENGIESMREISGWDLDEFENHRRGSGISAVTLNSEMQTVLTWLEYLARIGVVDDELPEKVHVPQIPDGDETNDELLEKERAFAILGAYRETPERHGTTKHALMELLWFTGARMGSIRGLDLRDYHSDEAFIEFRHRPESGTPLKNGTDGERAVGLPRSVCDVVDRYINQYRQDARDVDRQPLLTTAQGRPSSNMVRVWCYLATQPCLYQQCPHGKERDTCEYVHVHEASKCPSSLSPHRVRTGSITWQRDAGLPAEAVAERVNASLQVIESYYDKATARERLEQRRRPYIENLEIKDEP